MNIFACNRGENLVCDVLRGVRPGELERGGGHLLAALEHRVGLRAQSLRASARRRARMTAAPASAIQRALELWWSAEACGYGISTDGSPYWASSKIEPPERATATSAATSAIPNGVR